MNAKFFPGQWVRIKRVLDNAPDSAQASKFVGEVTQANEYREVVCGLLMIGVTIDDGCWRFPACCLEPIYDGNEVVSWESCAWRPEGVPA